MANDIDHVRVGTVWIAAGLAVGGIGYFGLSSIGYRTSAFIALICGFSAVIEGAALTFSRPGSPRVFDWVSYRQQHPAIYYLTRGIQVISIVSLLLYFCWVTLR